MSMTINFCLSTLYRTLFMYTFYVHFLRHVFLMHDTEMSYCSEQILVIIQTERESQ